MCFLLAIIFMAAGLIPLKLCIRLYRVPGEVLVSTRVTIWFLPLQIDIYRPISLLLNLFSKMLFLGKKQHTPKVNWLRVFMRFQLAKWTDRPLCAKAVRVFHSITHRVRVKELKLHTEIGLEDAADTALATGMLWSVMGNIYSRLSYIFNLQGLRPNIAVVPNFQQADYLRVDYTCIFEMRLGHIIIVLYQTLRGMEEVRTLLRRVSS